MEIFVNNFTLPANVENLTIKGPFDVNGKGNGLANNLIGNDKNNQLVGLGGNGFLRGNDGRDGLTGDDGNDSLIGGVGDDGLVGGANDDFLEGDAGFDTLTCGSGKDTFFFINPNADSDTIKDFVSADDSIAVAGSIFGGGLTGSPDGTPISADQFHLGSAAADNTDRFIYDTTSGNLFFDVDGTGSTAQVKLRQLTGIPTLDAADIVVF